MPSRLDVLLLNAPADLGKKSFDLAFPFQRQLNFGLLSLATVAHSKGFSVAIADPQVASDRDSNRFLEDIFHYYNPRVVGISCISGFSYPTALYFADAARQLQPDCTVVIGGKDHVGQLGAAVLTDCAAIDVVVRGEAEGILPDLLTCLRHGTSLAKVSNLIIRSETGNHHSTLFSQVAAQGDFVSLDYSFLPDARAFPPSVEVSRGCSFGCDFCVSARTAVRRLTPLTILDQVETLTRHYGDDELRVYFETPMFLMNDADIAELANERRRRQMRFTWRTETRVDYLNAQRLVQLANAGLRVVDLGFESGCPAILTRMKKTNHPDAYLERTKEVLRVAYDSGVTVKLNVLFYVGETLKTVSDTLAFLNGCMPCVDCVSAYPLLLYPGARLGSSLAQALVEVGGSLVTSPEWNARHLTPVNLSAELSYADASRLGLRFAKAFQTEAKFFHQKSYGYFSPGTTFQRFSNAAREFGVERLPFMLSGGDVANENRALQVDLHGGFD